MARWLARWGGAWIALVAFACLPAQFNAADRDEDGWLTGEDCVDRDPEIHPGAADPFGDGIDQNCDGFDGVDSDGDGSADSVDCAPHDPEIFPGAADPWEDGIDQDCDCAPGSDGGDGIDRDCDGYAITETVPFWAWDCDDDEPLVNPGMDERCDDGLDNDCDGQVDNC